MCKNQSWAFATFKENQRFSDPLQGSRPCLCNKKTRTRRVLSLVDDQGLEADGQGEKAGGIRHKSIKICDIFAPLRRNMRPRIKN